MMDLMHKSWNSLSPWLDLEDSFHASKKPRCGGSAPRDKKEVLPCGLRQDQAYELMTRDLTPEDFEMLSKLDEAVPKRDTAEVEQVHQLPHVKAADCEEKQCGICLY